MSGRRWGGGDAAVASGLEYIREWALLVVDGDAAEDCRRVRGEGGKSREGGEWWESGGR